MPYRRNYRPRRRYRPRGARHRYGLATVPRMMSRTLAQKRHYQVSTKTFWFKNNTEIAVGANGFKFTSFTTGLVNINPQFGLTANLFDQYKVLGLKIKLFPANVGIEPDAALFANNAFLRGNHIMWSDQRFDPGIQSPTQISDVINTASANMFNPRRPYSRAIYRPKGKVSWGSTRDISNNPDPWRAAIFHIAADTTPVPAPPATPPLLFFVTLQFKVVFRGRSQDT